jgi:hypothetical protein
VAKLFIQANSTSHSEYVFIQNSTSTTGAGLTGLVFNSAGLNAYYAVERGAATAITLVTLASATAAYASGGFVAVDGTNMPGLYRFDVPNALFSVAGTKNVVVMLKGATNMAPVVLEYQIVAFNPDDAVRLGLTALPNANAGALGGLPTGNASGQVAVATNNDKTGYSLSQAFPANFASLAITATTGLVSVGTNNDKTGYSLSQAFPANFSALAITPTTGLVSVGTNNDKSNYTLSTSQTFSTTGSVGSVTGSVNSVSTGVTVTTNNDKTGYSLATAPPTAAVIADAVWDEVLSGHLTAGTTGAALNSSGGATPAPTAAAIADAVWDEAYNTHTTAGSFGKLMDTLRKANYVIEGTTTASSTTTIINTNLTGYIANAFDNQTILFIGGAISGTSGIINGNNTGASIITLDEALPQAPASAVDFVILAQHVHTKNGIADSLLSRFLDSSGNGTDTVDERTVRSALRAMRNKVVVNSGGLIVYKEDDSTTAWSGTLSNTANVTVNPVGGS